MRYAIVVLLAVTSPSFAADCSSSPPEYKPVTKTFEATCSDGMAIVNISKAKSPVIKLNFKRDQEVSISTHSGAKSPGGNGSGAQVCIWRSWDSSQPCGQSTVSGDGFNDWDGKASCDVNVPKGVQFIRALQINSNADEQNTSIQIVCRRTN